MTKRSSFSIFKSVVMALFLREVQTRFGTKSWGYLWAVLDPLSMVIAFSLIKSAISERSMPGVDFPIFLATGILTYNFFKSTMTSALNAFESNSALFVYKYVKPIDTLFARFVLEFLVMCFAISFFLSVGFYFGLDISVKNFNYVLVAILWFGIFGFSMGILFAVLSVFYENFKKIISFLLTPLFFLSGLLYTVDSLPPFARELILYNPVIHFVEMIHGNYFLELDTSYVDYEYMLYWTIVPFFLGLFLYIRSEKKILAS